MKKIVGIISIASCLVGMELASGATSVAGETRPAPASSANSAQTRPNPAADIADLDWDDEVEYVQSIRSWLKTLPPFQQERARLILREARKDLHNLRKAIFDKKAELGEISFTRNTRPEDLPRLGLELQFLRRELRSRLEMVNQRLRHEAGVSMGPLAAEGFWLQPLSRAPAKTPAPENPKPDSKRSAHLS